MRNIRSTNTTNHGLVTPVSKEELITLIEEYRAKVTKDEPTHQPLSASKQKGIRHYLKTIMQTVDQQPQVSRYFTGAAKPALEPIKRIENKKRL